AQTVGPHHRNGARPRGSGTHWNRVPTPLGLRSRVTHTRRRVAAHTRLAARAAPPTRRQGIRSPRPSRHGSPGRPGLSTIASSMRGNCLLRRPVRLLCLGRRLAAVAETLEQTTYLGQLLFDLALPPV